MVRNQQNPGSVDKKPWLEILKIYWPQGKVVPPSVWGTDSSTFKCLAANSHITKVFSYDQHGIVNLP